MKYLLLILNLGCTITPAQVKPKCDGYIQSPLKEDVRWAKESLPVKVYIDPKISARRRVKIMEAAKVWTGFFVFTNSSNHNLKITEGKWYYPPTEQGLTSIYFKGGNIDWARTSININQNPDLKSLMVHEFGHVLGLTHRDGTIMNRYLKSNEIRTTLGAFEKSAIECGYGVKL